MSVVSNILAVTNIKRVNANATQIANGYMSCISELGDIQKETLLIHRLGLSHIVATDLNTMISLVETIRSEQETLETYLDDFQEYVTDDNKAEYDALVSNYEGMKYELANLMAYSANNDNEAAYALANGKIADYSSAMQRALRQSAPMSAKMRMWQRNSLQRSTGRQSRRARHPSSSVWRRCLQL